MGLNTVCAYLFWNFHEWKEGTYVWEGQADVSEFCRIAEEEGLLVILRPGPYACAEWEMGGLPWWLTTKGDVQVRSTDPKYFEPATRFLNEVGRVLGPLQITQGGPIIMVQVENEYGSFGSDADYVGRLRDVLVESGFEVPMFACNQASDMENGFRKDIFQVVNFGAGRVSDAFCKLRELQPTGPLMNGEYYPAWFDMWGRSHRKADGNLIARDIDLMLEGRSSFSIYMAHGGTSFGFWAGADRPFSPDTTSYDYDAPISEAGWKTPKFEAIRKVMSRHLEEDEVLPQAPGPIPTISIHEFQLNDFASVFDVLPEAVRDEVPRPMEDYGQAQGAILYRTELQAGTSRELSVGAAHDFCWVFVDGRCVGVLDRRRQNYSLTLPACAKACRLDLLVYAMGRVNFGAEVFDRKGILGTVTVGGSVVTGWEVFRLPFDGKFLATVKFGSPRKGPGIWRGEFEIDEPGDTFLDVSRWGKGAVWVNGHALGRFWNIGPTQTLYVPGVWLEEGFNEVVVLDLTGPESPVLRGVETPILDEIHPEKEFSLRVWALGEFSGFGLVGEARLEDKPGWQEVPFGLVPRGRYLCFEASGVYGDCGDLALSLLEAIDAEGKAVSKKEWRVVWVSSEETNYAAGHVEHVIDGQSSTYWQTERGKEGPHRIVVDLGASRDLSGVRVLGMESCRAADVRVYLADKPFGLQPARV